jgi:hypothetical protein
MLRQQKVSSNPDAKRLPAATDDTSSRLDKTIATATDTGRSATPRPEPRQRHPGPGKAHPVAVRVMWEGGGEEWIDGTARRSTQQAVLVTFADVHR